MSNSNKGTENRQVITTGKAKLKEFTIFDSKDNLILYFRTQQNSIILYNYKGKYVTLEIIQKW